MTAILGTLLLLAAGAVLIYCATRLVALVFRLWRLGLAARGILAALLAAIYTVSPIDAIPDVIVGIGWLDDLLVIGLTGFYIWRLISQRQAGRRTGGTIRPPQRPTFIPQLPPR